MDSRKYSLLEVMNDQRLAQLSLKERMQILNSFVDDLRAENHYMFRREIATGTKPLSQVWDAETNKSRPMINLASNDYLNLSQHPRVKEAAVEAILQYGLGSGSAPMLTGTSTLHKALEDKVARFKGTESAMLNSSGYAVNIGTLRALLGPADAAICDMYAHASLMDGCSHAARYFFKHNDMASLEMSLKKAAHHRNKFVVVDGVYSMDGDIARLDEIVDIAHRHGAWVVLDEAHADGVIGPDGRGTAAHFGLGDKVDVITGTFSKAIGSVGGYVAGKQELISYLQVACRSYMFASSSAMPTIAGVSAALDVIQEEAALRERLSDHIRYFREAATAMGFDVGQSATAIIPLIIGDDPKVKEMAYQLDLAGILVNPVPYPAVPKRLTRVRISLSAGLTRNQIDHSLSEIERVGMALGVLGSHPLRQSA
ncbi:MAG TPA: aminotransferase class I/II-fold pyridoxal phosphate-dependent enzyme [Bacteroidia bacterium]|nr:aminotransferase class I/II-fold pyridoxal phosphate-dependent enzyme [Bacteroidia bacterium]